MRFAIIAFLIGICSHMLWVKETTKSSPVSIAGSECQEPTLNSDWHKIACGHYYKRSGSTMYVRYTSPDSSKSFPLVMPGMLMPEGTEPDIRKLSMRSAYGTCRLNSEDHLLCEAQIPAREWQEYKAAGVKK